MAEATHTENKNLFELKAPFSDPIRRALFAVMKRPLARLLCLRELNALYEQAISKSKDENFVDAVLDNVGIRLDLPEEMLRNIPTSGSCVVVANHPFGIIDGLIFLKILRAVRPDAKIMANQILAMIPEMHEYMFEVDPFGTTESASRSIGGLKASMRWLKNGHLLGVFPAGEVASLRLRKRMVRDPQWNPTVGNIIRRAKCPAVPLFIKGHHGFMFNALGLVHPSLRTVMIPKSNFQQINKTVEVRIGRPIASKKIISFPDDKTLIDYLRFRTCVLRRFEEKKTENTAPSQKFLPIAQPCSKTQILAEINSLDKERILINSNPFMVFETEVRTKPGLLHEIGRLREETFRPVGEGTGQASDTDRFDLTYRHLILWDTEKEQIAGAYRFGRTDELVAKQGRKGLYSATLFRYKTELIHYITPALEMGRSFVCREYQRSYQPLLMLWKAIGEYVYRNPQYSKLFGCVSISNDYSPVSREVIVKTLCKHRSLPELAHLVKPKCPPKNTCMKRLDTCVPETIFDDLEEMQDLVGDIEIDKSIPVLLKQYLKLGGKVIAFNIDPGFGDCMDGLILVDLKQTEPKLLKRFMGAGKTEEFLGN